jgi:hypothetical protein
MPEATDPRVVPEDDESTRVNINAGRYYAEPNTGASDQEQVYIPAPERMPLALLGTGLPAWAFSAG